MILNIGNTKIVTSDAQDPCVYLIDDHGKVINPEPQSGAFLAELYDCLNRIGGFLYSEAGQANMDRHDIDIIDYKEG